MEKPSGSEDPKKDDTSVNTSTEAEMTEAEMTETDTDPSNAAAATAGQEDVAGEVADQGKLPLEAGAQGDLKVSGKKKRLKKLPNLVRRTEGGKDPKYAAFLRSSEPSTEEPAEPAEPEPAEPPATASSSSAAIAEPEPEESPAANPSTSSSASIESDDAHKTS